jgi:alpha-maltose-1-phosphate synthase
MKSLFLTNEYPPHVYGGAGVHVEYLTRELAKLIDVEVRCFGEQDETLDHLRVRGFGIDTKGWGSPDKLKSVFGAVRRNTDFNTAGIDADIVHCHTWYTHFGGILAKINYGLPLVITSHSLEPLRPWKREQLGGGYDFSCWVERTALQMSDAVVAVSREAKVDLLRLFDLKPERVHVIYNGIDTDEYKPVTETEALTRYGIDPSIPFILFVGRIARQKGIIHLANAIRYMDPGFQVVLCAGAPDTPEIAEEMKTAVSTAQANRKGVIWIQEMVNKATVFQLYTHAAAFICPSIYEPFGIINLEAMACETPVVASAVGGIKEVVVDGETGFLVPLEQLNESPFEPVNPDKFAHDLAAKINQLMANPDLRQRFGKAGRQRAEQQFSWHAIAAQTRDLYQSLLSQT